jgi:hypothetical protein
MAARRSSPPEISAEGAEYFNPLDTRDICVRLAAALENPASLAQWGERARQRYQKVSARQATDLDALCSLLLA